MHDVHAVADPRIVYGNGQTYCGLPIPSSSVAVVTETLTQDCHTITCPACKALLVAKILKGAGPRFIKTTAIYPLAS